MGLNLKLPDGLSEEVREAVDGGNLYSSYSEFVRDAVRDKMQAEQQTR